MFCNIYQLYNKDQHKRSENASKKLCAKLSTKRKLDLVFCMMSKAFEHYQRGKQSESHFPGDSQREPLATHFIHESMKIIHKYDAT